jgi:CDGSH-type Zn-finger protein
MTTIRIRVRDNGPLVVDGEIEIVDALGRAFPLPVGKPSVALCRCGHSATRPFCDGSHKSCGFEASERAGSGEEG